MQVMLFLIAKSCLGNFQVLNQLFKISIGTIFYFMVIVNFVGAQQPGLKQKDGVYSPHAERTFPTQVYWGDTHLHTALSMDAGAMGTLRSPEDAYRFGRGEQIVSSSGTPAKLLEPLDFLVLADHSDAMGTVAEIINGNPDFGVDPKVRRWQEMIAAGGDSLLAAAVEIVGAFGASEGLPDILLDRDFARRTWERYTLTADQFYEPGRFTTLIGFEWTSMPNWNTCTGS